MANNKTIALIDRGEHGIINRQAPFNKFAVDSLSQVPDGKLIYLPKDLFLRQRDIPVESYPTLPLTLRYTALHSASWSGLKMLFLMMTFALFLTIYNWEKDFASIVVGWSAQPAVQALGSQYQPTLVTISDTQARRLLGSSLSQGVWTSKNFIYGRSLDDDTPFFEPLAPDNLRGLVSPVPGKSIPLYSPALLPNSPRAYRNGTHEGYDIPAFSTNFVVSVYHGVVIRADHGYIPIEGGDFWAMLADTFSHPTTPEDTLDKLRGRQVWIDHGGGVVTRYSHLSSIMPEVQVGQYVARGQAIGKVGRSGIEPTGYGEHLHFEIMVGENYLGQGLKYEEIKDIITTAFE